MKNKNLENNIYGLSIITGTTGSGKPPILQNIISKYIEKYSEIKVITVEEPPEYFISGAKQINMIKQDCDKIK